MLYLSCYFGKTEKCYGLCETDVLCLSVCPQRMGVLNVGQRIEEQAEFEKIYKNGTAVCLFHCWHVFYL